MVWEFELFCEYWFNCFFSIFKLGLICFLESSEKGIRYFEVEGNCFFVGFIGVFGIV